MTIQSRTENRFWVTKNADGVIELHGTIKDTTPFNSIDEMLTDVNVFDCSAIKNASWMGLRRLHDHLNGLSKKSKVKYASVKIYEKMKLFGNLFEKYEIDLMGMIFVDDKGEIVEKNVPVNLLVQHAKEKGDTGFRLDGLKLVGPISFQLPSNYLEKCDIFSNTNDHNPNQVIVYFWQSYLNFLYLTTTQCQTQISDIQIGLSGEIQNIGSLFNTFENGLRTLLTDYDGHRSEDVPKMLETFVKWNDSLKSEIQKVTESVLGLLVGFFGDVDTDAPESSQKLADLQESIVSVMEPIKKVVQHIEIHGRNIGESLFAFVDIKKMKSEFDHFDDEQMNLELLSRVRDQFEIMDIMSEDSWEDTKPLIQKDLKAIQDYRKSCCVILQGFDLCRQVLEHRLSEVEVIINNKGNLSEIRTQVLEAITARMVTEQEKYCCRFFYPTEYAHSMKAGEGLGQSMLVFL